MIPLAILIVSSVTHFLFFGHPNSVVFDEVHIGDYIMNYWHGTYFFDVHPPLAKLLIAWFGLLNGASGQTIDWTQIGNILTPAAIDLRLLPMVLGTLIPLLIYWIARRLDLSKSVSTVAALMVSFENSLIVASRIIVVDMFLLFFGVFSLATYLEYRARANKNRFWFLALSILACSAAVGVKWTGLSFPLLIGLFELYSYINNQGQKFWSAFKKAVGFGLFYLAVIGIIYSILFAIHFALLPKPGPGDAYMNKNFLQESFPAKLIDLNITMYTESASLTKPHAYSSKWYTWPLMIRPIFYWQTTPYVKGGPNEYIYLFGNPIIYWLGTSSIFILLVLRLLRLRKMDRALFFILCGYLVNFIPFIFIGRVMFLYHYQSALLFSILAIAYILDQSTPRKKLVYSALLMIATIVLFIYFAPLTYGTPALSDAQMAERMWLPSWR